MTKLKIGIFTDSYKPYTSGVVRSIDTFSSELKKMGHKVFIFAPKYANYPEEEGVFRFPSVPAPTHPNYSLALPFSPRIRHTVPRLNLDIIHVHSPFLLGRVGARYAKRLGIPLVFTFHTLYEEYVHYVPFAQGITRDITQRLSADFCNQCNLVVTPTKVIAERLQSMGVNVPVAAIPTGIRVEDFNFGDTRWLRRQYNIDHDKKILLCVGRLGKEKNLEWLMESVARVERGFSPLQLVIVGGGPEEDYLKKRAKELGIGSKVTFTGALPMDKTAHCYRGADLFVFASVTETQGLVIGEAKSAGLPVVAVRAFGVSEMVEHGDDGFLTELNQEDFSRRVLQLLKDEDLMEQMSRQAKVNVLKISAGNCAVKLLRCYLDLLQGNNNPNRNISGY